MTESKVLEILQCRDDPVYFIEKYYGVALQQHQKEILTTGKHTFIDNKCNIGLSDYAYLIMHKVLFSYDQSIGICVPTKELADSLTEMIYQYFDLLDFDSGKPKVLSRMKRRIIFDNGMHVTVCTEYQHLRGMAFNTFIIIDIDKFKDYEEALNTILPIIIHSAYQQMIISGCADSLNTPVKDYLASLNQLTNTQDATL